MSEGNPAELILTQVGYGHGYFIFTPPTANPQVTLTPPVTPTPLRCDPNLEATVAIGPSSRKEVI